MQLTAFMINDPKIEREFNPVSVNPKLNPKH